MSDYIDAEVERRITALEAEVERLTAERDEARANIYSAFVEGYESWDNQGVASAWKYSMTREALEDDDE